MASILLTGYSGFVGIALAKRLTDGGHAVIAGGRSKPAPDLPVSTWRAVADINRDTDWNKVLVGVDVVVHAAGFAHADSRSAESRRSIHEINALGTARLASQASQAGVERFVLLSSIKVFGEDSGNHPYDTNSPLRPCNPYGEAKLAAEMALAANCAGSRMRGIVIRPPMIVGPRPKANLARLIALARTGLPLPLASIWNRRSILGLDNLADLIATVVAHPRPVAMPLLPTDSVNPSTPELLRWIGDVLERTVRLLPCPVAMLEAAGNLLGRSDMISRLTRSQEQDSRNTMALLNWQPRVPSQQSISAAVHSLA